jgi:hypothetical protein
MSLPNDPRASLSSEFPPDYVSAEGCGNGILFSSLPIDGDI